MKHTKRNLALGLCMLLLCMAFAPLGVAAESTNLIENGSMDEEDWYYTQGPAGWKAGRNGTTAYVDDVKDVTEGTAYIYHATGGVNNSPYVEIDALTYQSGEGQPQITPQHSAESAWYPMEGGTWYNLSFYHKKPQSSIVNRTAPQIVMTFAGTSNGETVSAAITPGTGILFYNYESEIWVKYELRFKTPAWTTQMMFVFATEYRKCASYDEISLTKDESSIEYLGGTPTGLSGDAITAWPNTTGGAKVTPTGGTAEILPVAFMSARQVMTTRPETGKIKAAFCYNAVDKTENVTCISAVYKKTAEGTTLVNCYIDNLERVAELNRLEQEITLPEAADGEEYTVKSYMWDSASGLRPTGVSNSLTY